MRMRVQAAVEYVPTGKTYVSMERVVTPQELEDLEELLELAAKGGLEYLQLDQQYIPRKVLSECVFSIISG